MNKEQSAILRDKITMAYFPYSFKEAIDKHCSYDYNKEELSSISSMGKYWKFIDGTIYIDVENNKISITQEKDVKIATLTLIVDGIESVDIFYKKGNKNILLEKSIFRNLMVGNIEVDYKNPITKIKLNFRYDLADPLEIEVDTILYEEPTIDYQKIYNEKMEIRHNVGSDLVNIYFQLATEQINKVKVELFLDKDSEDQMIGTYNVNENMLFISITGLAYGKYKFRVVQYSNDEKIAESNKISFVLNKPNYGGKRYIQQV